jgi:cation/acetate symporter
MKWGYVALAMGGIAAILLAFKPPKFLVTSILWAFGLLATTATPAILLGVWWKEANKLALIVSSIFCGISFIVISPHVLPSICVGKGLVAALGMSGGMVTIPLSFAMFIILSIVFNRMSVFKSFSPTLADKRVIDRIHGWGVDYEETRYNGIAVPIMISIVCLGIFCWGLVPW